MVAGGNIWRNPHPANHSNMNRKTYMKKKKQTQGRLIYSPSFISIPGIL